MPEDSGSGQEKTEAATPKKRSKAREEGQVAKSIELSSVFVLLSGVAVLFFTGHFFGDNFSQLMRTSFTFNAVPQFDIQFCLTLLNRFSTWFFKLVLPVMGAVVFTGLVINIFQVGFKISTKAIAPKLDKFNIIKGFGRLLSVKSFGELIKSILKLTIIGCIVYFIIRAESRIFLHMYHWEVSAILIYMLKVIFKIFIWVIMVMMLLAIADVAFQRWQFEKQLKMTKQEVKDETKQTEGDPQVKSRIKSIQIQTARRRMMHEVPEADVVVTNPTHLALAIRYEPGAMGAPRVVAKGAGHVAERIKQLASDHQIPVIENKKLAQNLYKLVKIGEEVPIQLYQAVAELLAYVYKLKGKTV